VPHVNALLVQAEARIGTVIRGKWRIERLLGVGGMAAVYEARHRNRSRVALKILHRHLGLSADQVVRFQREGYAANHVGHPGVAEVYDDDVDEHGCAFLVMELLEGETAAHRAAALGGRLPAGEVLSLADELLDVLAAAHARGILHRDIKPDNLFLTRAGALKVLDFGIARLSDPELGATRTEAGTLLGTPGFVPPEQARGRVHEIDARTDVWAVGATLFTLLTGRFVHEASTPNEQLGLAMTADAPSLAGVAPGTPSALVRVVDRALAYEQHARWPDARSMQEAVRWVRAEWPRLTAGADSVPGELEAPVRTPTGATPTLDGHGAKTSERARAATPVSRKRAGRFAAILLACLVATLALATRRAKQAPVGASAALRDPSTLATAAARLSEPALIVHVASRTDVAAPASAARPVASGAVAGPGTATRATPATDGVRGPTKSGGVVPSVAGRDAHELDAQRRALHATAPGVPAAATASLVAAPSTPGSATHLDPFERRH
jgi:eukaryotic-like serine/threonine-protein kinase